MSSSNFGNIQYKASNGQINLDEAQGIVECFVAGIGNKDSVGDICATGAFAKSLQRRKPRVVWGHNWNDPIGKVLEIYEVPVNDPRLPMKMKMAGIGGLYAKVQFNLQSEKGREAFANVAFFGEEQEWSIGYKTLRSQFDQNLQANVLYEVELYEVSPVLHGANQLTGTISVKSDEEKMHGMMPLVIGAPSAGKPSGEGLFDEGIAQRISGPQLAGVVAELSRRAGGPVMVVEATENSVIFVKPGKGKFRIGYHFTGSEYMFGKPELLEADQPKPAMPSGPAPMPGISAKPTGESKPQVVNPAMPMPVAMKPENGGMVIVPLPPVKYEGGEGKEKPELVAEERELAESLVRIAGKYGKFDEDGDGIWAGYYPPAENKVKDIGVKCANCVLYQGNGKCKILALNVEPEGKCRFAIIPDGVVVGFGKKEYNDMLDEDEVKMVEDVEAKYPGEFILGAFRNVVKKRRKKRKEYKTLEEWGIEEQELAEKGLDPFLAHNASYVIPVNPEDAFVVKSILDPVFEYHRIDTHVNEFGIVINSPLDQESKDAIQVASVSAYGILKKKLETEGIEEKALGRRIGRAIASRGIDRPNLGGRRSRRSRGSGINPPPGWDPRTVEDANLNSMVGDGTPWEQPDPTPFGPGSINSPKPSKRQMRQRADLADTEKLSSGKRNERRHADRSADMEEKFPNPDEMAKRKLQEDIAEQWISQGLGWEEVPRYNADKGKSSDYLRGRELGVNQSRLMWNGDDVRKRPAKFDEKAKSSSDYKDWYMDYANAVSKYLDANAKEGDDNWAGIEEALKTEVYEKRPDTSTWRREDVDAMGRTLDELGLNPQRGVRSSLKDREPAKLSSGRRAPWEKVRPPQRDLPPRLRALTEDEEEKPKPKPKPAMPPAPAVSRPRDEGRRRAAPAAPPPPPKPPKKSGRDVPPSRPGEGLASGRKNRGQLRRDERQNLVDEVVYLEDQRRAYRGNPKDENYAELVNRTDEAIAKLEAFDKRKERENLVAEMVSLEDSIRTYRGKQTDEKWEKLVERADDVLAKLKAFDEKDKKSTSRDSGSKFSSGKLSRYRDIPDFDNPKDELAYIEEEILREESAPIGSNSLVLDEYYKRMDYLKDRRRELQDVIKKRKKYNPAIPYSEYKTDKEAMFDNARRSLEEMLSRVKPESKPQLIKPDNSRVYRDRGFSSGRSDMPSDEEIYNRRMGGETLQEVADDLGVERIDVRKAEQRHMAQLREEGRPLSSGRKINSYEDLVETLGITDKDTIERLSRLNDEVADRIDDKYLNIRRLVDGSFNLPEEQRNAIVEYLEGVKNTLRRQRPLRRRLRSTREGNDLQTIDSYWTRKIAREETNSILAGRADSDSAIKRVARTLGIKDRKMIEKLSRLNYEVAEKFDDDSFDIRKTVNRSVTLPEEQRNAIIDALEEVRNIVRADDRGRKLRGESGTRGFSSGRKINSYEDLVDESQKLDSMDRNSPEFESRANELLKEASRLQKYLASLERGEGGDEDFEDSDVFDDIEEIKDDIKFFKKGGTRGFSSGRKINSYEDLVDESQKLDAMDRNSPEFESRANELLKEASRLQKYLASLERDADGDDNDFEDSDVFDDIEEIKDDIRSFKKGGTRGLSSGRKNRFSRDLADFEVERVADELDNMSPEDRQEYEDYAAEYLTGKGMSPDDPDWDSELQGRIEESVADNINEQLDMADRASRLGEPSPSTRADTRGVPQSSGRDFFSSGRIPDWEKYFSRQRLDELDAGSGETDVLYKIRQRGGIGVDDIKEADELMRQLVAERNELAQRAFDGSIPEGDGLFSVLDVTNDEETTDILSSYDDAINDLFNAILVHSEQHDEIVKRQETLDDLSSSLYDGQDYMSPFVPSGIDKKFAEIENNYDQDEVLQQKLNHLGDLAYFLDEANQSLDDDIDVSALLSTERRELESLIRGDFEPDEASVEAARKMVEKIHKKLLRTVRDEKTNDANTLSQLKDAGTPNVLDLEDSTNFIKRPLINPDMPIAPAGNLEFQDDAETEAAYERLDGLRRKENILNNIFSMMDIEDGKPNPYSKDNIDKKFAQLEEDFEGEDLLSQKFYHLGLLSDGLLEAHSTLMNEPGLDPALTPSEREDLKQIQINGLDFNEESVNAAQKTVESSYKKLEAMLQEEYENTLGEQSKIRKDLKLSSGRMGDKLGGWQKTDDGFEADAPGIDGLYSIGKGEDGKFYVTRTYDAVREGGQYQMDTEHDFGFADIGSAKRWAEADYGKATMAWNYDQVYDDETDSEIGFSSGRVRTAASIYNINPAVNPEMPGMLANRDFVDDAEITLASGRTRGQRAASRLPKVNATDKEIFERRMEGASLEDVANELGVPRQVVRQAEVRHMARMRGTLDSPIDSSYVQDYKDVESLARDIEEFAALEAAQERADELFHDRIQAGESPSAIAKEYGLRPGQVIEGAERHKQMLRERDIAAEKWLAENPEFASGRKGRSFKNPMEGMFAGERLSSGKQDEVYRAVQDRLIKMLEGADPDSWEFPWHKSGFVPTNPSNKNRPYTNVNALMLMFAQQDMGYKTPMWAGFEQWKKLGGSVRKGEKGTQIFIPTIVPPKKDKDGNVVKEGFVFFKVGYVFNADQIDGVDIDALKGEQLDPAERLQELEDALAEVGAIVKTGTDGRAYYRPSTDEISMPPFESFKSREGYYATLAHEMMHWTGHTSRLNRPNMNHFGNEAYAREELVAEIASAFFLAALGVSAEPREDHAQYLASWLRALKNDPNALQEAFKEAQKAADFVIGKSPKMQKKLGKAAAEKGALPGNKDLVPSMPEVSPALSSGSRIAPDGRPFGPRFMRNADGSKASLADVLGKPKEGILGEFRGFTYPDGRREYEKDYFVRDSNVLGKFGRWSAKRTESGKWSLNSLVFDDWGDPEEDLGDDDSIDRDFGGASGMFDSAEEMADYIKQYEDERNEFNRAYEEAVDSGDLERVQKLLDEESARMDAEYQAAIEQEELVEESISKQAMELSWEDISRQLDEETAHWSPQDWQEYADELRADIDNENARGGFSSGRVSRYNDADPATIPSVKGAAGRDDEIGSNTRAIIKNTYVPTDLYDLNDVRANGTPIRFKYKGKDRTIYPTGIKAKKEGGIYFIGVDEDSGQYRSFNLEKIDGLIDGATLPINPRQPGVAKGDGKQVYVERFSSGRNEAKAAVSRMLNDIDPRVWENDDWEYEEELDRMAKSFAESYYVEDNDTVDDVVYELQLLQDALAQDGTAESDRKADFLLRVLDNFETNDYENRRERSDGQPSDSDIFEEQEGWGLYSGRKKRPASSKRRPMSDEEMQAYRDGLRLRAKTIPKKRRGGPEASEFSSGRTSQQTGLPITDASEKVIRRYFERKETPTKVGNVADNDMRGPFDAWQVPVANLLKYLGRERIVQGRSEYEDVTPEMLGELLGMSSADIKKLSQRGASISEADAYDLIDRIMGGPGDLFDQLKMDGYMQAIWGWNSKPYWYDADGNEIDRETFDELVEDGEFVEGLLSPKDLDAPDDAPTPSTIGADEGPVAPARTASDKTNLSGRINRSDFTIGKLAEFLGVEPGNRKAMIDEINKRTNGRINVTSTTVGSWNTDGVPLAWADIFKELGVIERAEEIWGEAGKNYDSAMRKVEFHKRLDAVLKNLGVKISDSRLSSILDAANFRKEVKNPTPKLSVEAMAKVGKTPVYAEVDMARLLDTISAETNTNITLDDIREVTLSSGRRAQRRVAQAGRESVESLSSGRKNNGAPDNITPRMQNELIYWARNNKWSGFAQSLLKQFERDGFLSEDQWTRLLIFVDNQKMKR